MVFGSQWSNTASAPAPAPNVVLLMDGLTGDAQGVGDRLPRPAEASGVVDVQLLELLDEVAKCRDRGEADRWIATVDRVVQIGQLPHRCQLRLTPAKCQPWLTRSGPGARPSTGELGIRFLATFVYVS